MNVLKITSQKKPTDHKLVLQNIASQVPSIVKNSNLKRSISEINIYKRINK